MLSAEIRSIGAIPNALFLRYALEELQQRPSRYSARRLHIRWR